jgi:hypothetical protein
MADKAHRSEDASGGSSVIFIVAIRAFGDVQLAPGCEPRGFGSPIVAHKPTTSAGGNRGFSLV